MKKSKFLLNRIITYGLVCMTLFSLFLLAGIYAKYTTSKSENVSMEVKSFKITVDDDNLVNFSKNLSVAMNPQSDSQTYNFTVTSTSEVNVTLKVTLETEGNLPLLYTYKVGDGAEVDFTTDLDGNYYFVETLPANSSADPKKYTIYVRWDPAYKSYAYAVGVEALRLSLHAEQTE